VAPSRRDRHQAVRTAGAVVTGPGETPTLIVMGNRHKRSRHTGLPGAVWL
jgi:hypothetical protein